MERKKWWASLIAVAVGLAFSVGSASAYEQGDFADEASEGKLIPYYMAGDNLATVIAIQNASGTGDAVIIEVAVHDTVGDLQATGEICLAENQFGYAVLKEEMMMDEMMVTLMVGRGDQTTIITGLPGSDMTTGVAGRAGSSVETMPGEGGMIGKEGFVVIRETFTVVNSTGMMDACDQPSDATDTEVTATDVPDFATWAILQDVGEGSSFGTEIPSATVTVATRSDTEADGINCNADGSDCDGLIPQSNIVTVRFDNNMENWSESTIYVWLSTPSSTRATRMPAAATAYCEGLDDPVTMGDDTFSIDIQDQVNVINAMDLGCEARGVLNLTLPAAMVGTAWSHIAQMGGGFRMNFAGYEAAP